MHGNAKAWYVKQSTYMRWFYLQIKYMYLNVWYLEVPAMQSILAMQKCFCYLCTYLFEGKTCIYTMLIWIWILWCYSVNIIHLAIIITNSQVCIHKYKLCVLKQVNFMYPNTQVPSSDVITCTSLYWYSSGSIIEACMKGVCLRKRFEKSILVQQKYNTFQTYLCIRQTINHQKVIIITLHVLKQ